jgi:hypothetical protein
MTLAPGANPTKHFPAVIYGFATLKGRLLALPENIRLGWKGLSGTKTLACYENQSITAVKSLIGLAPE